MQVSTDVAWIALVAAIAAADAAKKLPSAAAEAAAPVATATATRLASVCPRGHGDADGGGVKWHVHVDDVSCWHPLSSADVLCRRRIPGGAVGDAALSPSKGQGGADLVVVKPLGQSISDGGGGSQSNGFTRYAWRGVGT